MNAESRCVKPWRLGLHSAVGSARMKKLCVTPANMEIACFIPRHAISPFPIAATNACISISYVRRNCQIRPQLYSRPPTRSDSTGEGGHVPLFFNHFPHKFISFRFIFQLLPALYFFPKYSRHNICR